MKDPTDSDSLHLQLVELGDKFEDKSERAVAARIAETAGDLLQTAVRIGPVEGMASLLVALSALQRLVELDGFDSSKLFAHAEQIALLINFDVERAAGDA